MEGGGGLYLLASLRDEPIALGSIEPIGVVH
jgi:hypothetical protein